MHNTDVNYRPFNLHDPLLQQHEIIRMMQEGIKMWKNETLHRRHTCDLEITDDKIALNTWLKVSELFPEKLDLWCHPGSFISSNNYKKHILKDLNIANDICRKC